MPDFYALDTMKIFERYKLSAGAKKLMKVYDEYEKGSKSEVELGRMIRLSPKDRKALTDILATCTKKMKVKGEQARCLEMMHACTEMLRFADNPPVEKGLDFRKFPSEIRRMIYREYTKGILSRRSTTTLVAERKQSPCLCPSSKDVIGRYSLPEAKLNMALAFTASWVNKEYLQFLFETYHIQFSCTCEMLARIKQNHILRQSANTVGFHWTGPKSVQAFRELAKCRQIHTLEIFISKLTTDILSPREARMRRLFRVQRPPRLYDALGFDELLKIRGIVAVHVEHANVKLAEKRSGEERTKLRSLLWDELTKRKSDEDDSDSVSVDLGFSAEDAAGEENEDTGFLEDLGASSY